MIAFRPFVSVLALSVALVACDKETGGAKCPEPSSTPVAGGAAAALDAELVRTASGGAIKMKIRTDASGALVKQSLYHRDLAAIPKPVHDLAAQKFPGGKTEQVESELYLEHGRVYEVEVTTTDGKKCEIAASAEGVELYTECVVEPASLPPPVTAAIAKLYPDAKVLEAETKKGPNMDEITVEVQVGGGEHYVRVKPDGTVIQRLVRIPAVVEIPVE